MSKFLINIYFKGNKLKLWPKLFGFLKTINHLLKQGIPPCFKAVFSFSMNFEMKLIFSMKFLNETRVVLPFSMNEFRSIIVCMEINFKLLPDFLALLKTSNLYFEMSDGPYLQNKDSISCRVIVCSIFISVGIKP